MVGDLRSSLFSSSMSHSVASLAEYGSGCGYAIGLGSCILFEQAIVGGGRVGIGSKAR